MDEMVKTVQKYKTIIQTSFENLEKSKIVNIFLVEHSSFFCNVLLYHICLQNDTRQVSYQNTQISFENEESNVRFGNKNQDSFAQAQLQETNQLGLVQERANQMRQLESDIVDLNSMFKDISVLVHEQGDLVGNYLVVSQYIKLQK